MAYTDKSFVEFCQQYIVDNIRDYKGQTIYGCDLGMTLTEGINADGTLTYSSYESRELIKQWWDDCNNFYVYAKENFGETYNPFESERFIAAMVICGVDYIMGQMQTISEVWDEKVEITDDFIEKLGWEVENYFDEIF